MISERCTRNHVDDPQPHDPIYDDIRFAINKHGYDAESNTPDFVLADYLVSCLKAFCYTLKYRNTTNEVRENYIELQ